VTGSPDRSVVDAELDRNGLEMIERDDCLALLGSVPVGRVGLCVHALPLILPVNFVVAQPPGGGEPIVVVRSAEGSKLAAAFDRAVLAFEVDGYDAFTHSGWSVLVQGVARVLVGADRDWAGSLPLLPWAIEGASMFIGLDTDVVRGRRFGVPVQAPHLRH